MALKKFPKNNFLLSYHDQQITTTTTIIIIVLIIIKQRVKVWGVPVAAPRAHFPSLVIPPFSPYPPTASYLNLKITQNFILECLVYQI